MIPRVVVPGSRRDAENKIRLTLKHTTLAIIAFSTILLFFKLYLNNIGDQAKTREVISREQVKLLIIQERSSSNGGNTSCTLDAYHRHYERIYPSKFNTIIDRRCLEMLMDENPNDMTLKVGMVQHIHAEIMQQATPPSRHFLYYCHSHCGGLGDRLRAMLYTFHLSWTLNATFGIQMETPVHWESYFSQEHHNNSVLNQHGWLHDYLTQTDFSIETKLKSIDSIHYKIMPWGKIPMIPNKTAWISDTDMERTLFPTQQETVYLSGRTFPADIYVKANTHVADLIQKSRLTGMNRPKLAFVFSRLYLNRISPFLEFHVKPYALQLKNAADHVVGVQIRIGDAASGWGHDKRNTLASVDCFVNRTKQLCRQQTSCVVWLTADNEDATIKFKEAMQDDGNISVIMSQGLETSHLDRSHFENGTDFRLANLKTFLDWYILAEYADTFVVSHSLYSEMASYYRMFNESHFRPVSRFESMETGRCSFTLS
jgi:hypothetical protein